MYCVHREVSHGYETKVQLEYTLANYIAIPVLLYYIAATHSFGHLWNLVSSVADDGDDDN